MAALVFILSLAVAGLQICVYYDELPATLATHFGYGGAPNGWMSRETFIIFYFGILLFMLGTFIGIAAFLKKIGPRYINIPHKSYWLAPERIEESVKSLRNWMHAFAAFIAAFIIALYQMLIMLNIADAPPVLDETMMFRGLGGFLVVTTVFIACLYRRFHKPKPAA